jgi:hypothetical protein
MPSREDLHKLVEALPEAAFDSAAKMLQELQQWPSALPPGLAELQYLPPQERRARMRELFFPGSKGAGSGSGILRIPAGQEGYKGRRGLWSTGHGDAEDRVQESHYYFDEHEIVVKERFVIEERGLVYRHEILELGSLPESREIVFPIKLHPGT